MVCIGNATLQQLDVYKCVLHSNPFYGLAAKVRGGVPRRKVLDDDGTLLQGWVEFALQACINGMHGMVCATRILDSGLVLG